METTTADAVEAAAELYRTRPDLRTLPGGDAQRYWPLCPRGQDSDSERARFAFRREWRLCVMRQAGKSSNVSARIAEHYRDLDDAVATSATPTSRGIW